jgi:C4-dicarboxylate transporter
VRAMRTFFDLGLLVLGIVVILTASLLVEEIRIRSLIILVGILLIQASVWGLAHRVLPNRR